MHICIVDAFSDNPYNLLKVTLYKLFKTYSSLSLHDLWPRLLSALICKSVLEWPVYYFLKTETSLTDCHWRTLGAIAPVTVNIEFQV